ncbi:MAG: AAA family ATPase [Novipirellula sp. JB048]
MSKSIEITAKYLGERFQFDNSDGTRVIIGSALVCSGSKSLLADRNLDPDEALTVKGQADEGDLTPGGTYRFFGTWTSYFNRRRQAKEQQFTFRTVVPHIPHDRDGIINYLAIAGRGNGIGPSKAKKLVDAFGVDSVLQVCRDHPSDVSDAVNVQLHQAEFFAQKLNSQHATESATLEVDKLLTGRGFAKTLVTRVIKAWGNEAAEKILADPYALMQFRGVGFGLTDKLWLTLGKDPAAIERQALCLWHAMASDQEGHTWHPAKQVVRRLHQAIGGGNIDYKAAIVKGIEYGQLDDNHYGAIASQRVDASGNLTEMNEGTELWLAESKHASAEAYVAAAITAAMNETTAQMVTRYAKTERIESVVMRHAVCQRCRRQLTASTVHILDGRPYGPTCIDYVDPIGSATTMDLAEWLQQNPSVRRYIEQQPSGVIRLPEVSLWPDPSSLEIIIDGENRITEHQTSEAAKAMSGRVGVLGGSPGTGKTSLLAAIIKAVHRTGRVGLHEIGIGAPTGKAAVRLTESLLASGVSVRARTWHSLLGIGGVDANGQTSEFKHGENCKLPYKIIFGDESSMPTINMIASIFRARATGTHMLFAGDVNQLPPVGNGAPLRDLIAAGLPYGELREIQRNSGGIVESCAAIRDGEPWTDTCDVYRSGESPQTNLVFTDDRTPSAQIRSMLSIIEDCRSFADPIWDVQVLTAVNKRSDLSRTKLNEILQDALNPNPKVDGTPFRVGDKVVCLKNGFYRSVYSIDNASEEIDASDNGEVYVANGELGRVEAIENKHLTISLQGPERLIQVFRGRPSRDESSGNDGNDKETSTGCPWDLGYTLSVHKFQGSEQRIVIGILDPYPGARNICDRAWLYTLISRAKEFCYLVGTRELANRMCRVQKMDQRKTFLTNRIQLAMLEQEMVGI